ncbi:Uncharacterized protein FKW44_019780, partial [Caligus rogercresseyi]
TDEFVAKVKRKANEDGNKSYAKLAAEIGCSKQTIANTINKDLGYCSYKKRHRMILTEGTQAWLLENLPYHWSPDLWPPSPLTATPSTISSGAWSRTRPTQHSRLPQAAIVEEFANMKKDALAKTCGRFRHRLEMVVAADGGYIEK